MIPRYSRPEMTKIWSDENRFKIWLEVELTALEKMAELGLAPESAYLNARKLAKFDAKRVLEIEDEVKHDVIAFLTNVAEYVGEDSRFIHRGMTSSDLLDTSFALQLKQSGELILASLEKVIVATLTRAEEYRYTPTIGRSHGIHAEPTTFGLKVLSWAVELTRAKKRIQSALHEACAGKISGPVGTFAQLPPAVEEHVMSKLGLVCEPVASQIVHRDRHASFFSALALLGSSIERFAVEIRHLQRTEVREVEEKFTAGQKGSSAMPHKRNPILSENLTGLARLLRGYVVSAMENIALWHERDISHSSVERVIAPDACIVSHFMLHRFLSLVEGMVVYPKRMQENLDSSRGLIFSGSLLVALVDGGMVREDAYKEVQLHALAAWDGGDDLKGRALKAEKILSFLSVEKINEIFDIKRHFQQVDYIFERSLKEINHG
jgi:adenylosuccinate lyase